ncbi:MAG: mechanosensitive ion channel family protein [Thermodesulfobacteriota bacterium]
MDLTMQNLINQGINIGLKILGAIAFWIIGVWLIGLIMRLLTKSLERQKVDTIHIRYIVSGVKVLLKVVLIVSILGYFGIQTTTFAALMAAIGFAIGAAWGGLLSNLAAGAFLVFLKPFKIGDLISAAGVLGTVKEVGLFVTTLDTLDNVKTYIGNNKIFSDNIQNFTINPFRRVDLMAQLSHGTDHNTAIKLLKERLAKIPNVLSEPLADVEILQFNLAGPVLAVRPYCHNDHYWQVYFDTNRLIRESFGEAGFAVPEQHLVVRNKV